MAQDLAQTADPADDSVYLGEPVLETLQGLGTTADLGRTIFASTLSSEEEKSGDEKGGKGRPKRGGNKKGGSKGSKGSPGAAARPKSRERELVDKEGAEEALSDAMSDSMSRVYIAVHRTVDQLRELLSLVQTRAGPEGLEAAVCENNLAVCLGDFSAGRVAWDLESKVGE